MPHAQTIHMGHRQGQLSLKTKGEVSGDRTVDEGEKTDRLKIDIVYLAKAITHWDKDTKLKAKS